MNEHPSLSSSVRSMSAKNLVATATNASSGQFSNQSIVQQLTRDGNFLKRILKLSPIGDMARTMCNCILALSTKRLNNATGLPSVCKLLSFCLSIPRIFSQISAFSSLGYRLGTSPEFSRLLTSSRNDSSLIYF